jgi:hypothetical protein
LNQPLLVSHDTLEKAPQIIGTNEERVMMTSGDTVYAPSDESGTTRWQIYRKGQALTNPDNGELLGHEAEYLGDAETVAPGNPQKLRITRLARKSSPGQADPAREVTQFSLCRTLRKKPISGKVISAYGVTALQIGTLPDRRHQSRRSRRPRTGPCTGRLPRR